MNDCKCLQSPGLSDCRLPLLQLLLRCAFIPILIMLLLVKHRKSCWHFYSRPHLHSKTEHMQVWKYFCCTVHMTCTKVKCFSQVFLCSCSSLKSYSCLGSVPPQHQRDPLQQPLWLLLSGA